MKYSYFFYSTILLLLIASCSGDNIIDNPDDGEVRETEILCTVNIKDFVNIDNNTRSSLSYGSTGMLFSWENGDQLTIFPAKENEYARGLYSIQWDKAYDDIPNKHITQATFKDPGFTLTPGMRYYAISTTESKAPMHGSSSVRMSDARNISLTYDGQRQEANGSSLHLGAYDYLVASAMCEEAENAVHFSFAHMGATIRAYFKGLPEGAVYKEMYIYDSENVFRHPNRTLNLPKGYDAEADTYAASWDELDINSDEYKTSPLFCLKLGKVEDGVEKGITIGSNGVLDTYMELPPFDFTNKKFVFNFIPANSETKAYHATRDGYKLNAGKAYQMVMTAEESTSFTINVKVNYNWMLGSVNNASSAKTRATGDPGYDDGYIAPDHIYAFFCLDGKVKDVRNISVDGIGNNTWTDPDNSNIITYKTPLIFTAVNANDIKTARVYIYASNTNITHGIVADSPEDNVRGLKYNLPSSDHQDFLRNLYSTPWKEIDAANFVGKLDVPYKDIILYHTAAKVDLKWNNETGTALSGDVKVNNVKATDLFLFKPTENTYDSGSYTVSAPITTGTQWNGRQVFYLPQFANSTTPESSCKYNVTIGGNTQDVQFSPSTANGFTSWLRWLNTY